MVEQECQNTAMQFTFLPDCLGPGILVVFLIFGFKSIAMIKVGFWLFPIFYLIEISDFVA